VHVYWVQVDGLADSLMNTNFIPYVKTKIENRTDTVGRLFNFKIPDSTFFDDDGNNTLTLHAKLSNGNPLPEWITFDTITRTFSGTPTIVQTLNTRITATDNAGASVSATLKITIKASTAINQIDNQHVKIFPNPTTGRINVSLESLPGKPVTVEVCNLEGKLILRDTFKTDICIDMAGKPKGMYILNLFFDHEVISRNVCIN